MLLIIFFNVFCGTVTKSAPNKLTKGYLYLNIYFSEATAADTLTVSLGKNMLATLKGTAFRNNRSDYKAVKNDKGYFRFEIPVSQSSGYFDLRKNRVMGEVAFKKSVSILEPQFWEINDSLTIRLSFKESKLGLGAECKFNGRGADKYNLINQFKHVVVDNKLIKITEMWPKGWNGNILQYDQFDAIPTVTQAKLQLLENYKRKLSAESYNVLKANLIYAGKSAYFGEISAFVASGQFSTLDLKSREAIINRFNYSYDFEHNYGIEEKYLAKSINFLHFMANKLQTASRLSTGKYSPEWIFNKAKDAHFNPELKELMVMMQLTTFRLAENPEVYYAMARTIVKDSSYLALLKELSIRSPGKKFTDFKLESIDGLFKTLQDFKNKVVLIDFWYTGCGHCQDFYRKTLIKAEKKFKDNPHVVFLSISIDRDKPVWKESVKKGTYTSLDAENVYTNGLRALDPIVTRNNITGYPFVILLDRENRIKFFNSNNLYQEELLTAAINELL
ncbi:TlpA family protein disulfide reductase [Pedobacter frigoris]|nr:thioredoxin family protein [Pedobacter frigoris]